MAENPSRSTSATPREKAPEPERFPAEHLIPRAAILFDSTPDLIAGALATAPANRVQFSLDEVKELLRAREGVIIDPYAGVPETYPVPAGHLDSLSRAEAEAADTRVRTLLAAREEAAA